MSSGPVGYLHWIWGQGCCERGGQGEGGLDRHCSPWMNIPPGVLVTDVASGEAGGLCWSCQYLLFLKNQKLLICFKQ